MTAAYAVQSVVESPRVMYLYEAGLGGKNSPDIIKAFI